MKIDLFEVTAQWIHKDDRGEIVCFYKDGREYTLLTTLKGFARGGCVHPRNTEHAVVLKGVVEYHLSNKNGTLDMEIIYKEGDAVMPILPNSPHYFVALEDSVTLEWGADPDEKDMKHPIWRDVVELINDERRLQ